MLPTLIGCDTSVPCVDGGARRHVNLDYAATTPAMSEVWEAVQAFVPWYASVHRGGGVKSRVATAAYEGARGVVAEFAGARPGDEVVFVRNTTEAINVLAAALPAGARVLSSPAEHHANMLPWRRHEVSLLPFTRSAGELLEACERTLRGGRFDLVAVSGASNVTGEIWPVAELAEIAHRHGAELFVDAAQLAPHRRLDMAAAGIDHLALSGHKLYAPFGAGALVGRIGPGEPLLQGGGAMRLVTLDDVVWADAPGLFEAGTPNLVGAVALGAACRALLDAGMDAVAEREERLATQLRAGLAGVPGLRTLALWEGADRVGVVSFTLDGYRHSQLSAILAAEYAIGVRHGRFCAHPLVAHLLGVPEGEMTRLLGELRAGARPAMPGAVRASLGLGSEEEDVDRLVAALHEIASAGPRARYRHVTEQDVYEPADDSRAWPQFPFELVA